MKLAVIQNGGKQYLVKEGQIVILEKMITSDKKVSFDQVLLTADGDQVKVGTPTTNSQVIGQVVGEGKGKKVMVVKFKRKVRYHKRVGHRQPFTKVKIDSIAV